MVLETLLNSRMGSLDKAEEILQEIEDLEKSYGPVKINIKHLQKLIAKVRGDLRL